MVRSCVKKILPEELTVELVGRSGDHPTTRGRVSQRAPNGTRLPLIFQNSQVRIGGILIPDRTLVRERLPFVVADADDEV